MKTVFITGASRGVGLAIAKKFASAGWNIGFVAKTVDVDPRLPGTIASAQQEILTAGAQEVLAIPCDIRNLTELNQAIDAVGEKFGQIDLLVNNASSIYLLKTEELPEKRYDLMHQVIVRAALFAAKYALAYLKKSSNPHILNIAPPLSLKPQWFDGHNAYTMCKFASSMMVMGLAAEFKNYGIAVNALWPATLLDTAAVQNLLGGAEAIKRARNPQIMADAAYILSNKDHLKCSGNYYLDEELIVAADIDLNQYSVVAGAKLLTDLYVER